ncbi:NAD(P)/FAD-dependent oxidoreductase [Noviherbaspirillum sp.]|uniref:NAD(P)/FAD-dependent oxidoreductase n=1 Tax=Noviherbaspirillum sp. TaxID=1926288 RepID=UPI002FE154E1
MSHNDEQLLDCVIVGGGAAGLTAATYLARFRRQFKLIDAGSSRLLWIPTSHNYPGFIHGIHGGDILQRLREQAEHYGATSVTGKVERISKSGDDLFITSTGNQEFRSRTVLVATGVVDVAPDFPDIGEAVAEGALRYCPICDGFESIAKKVAVIGKGNGGLGEALFVRHYATDVTLFSITDPIALSADEHAQLDAGRVRAVSNPVTGLSFANGKMTVSLQGAAPQEFDVVYAALGTRVNSAIVRDLGAECTPNGELVVNNHQQTTVENLYAAGDIVKGLNQITVAMGHAAIAATAIHNRLRA